MFRVEYDRGRGIVRCTSGGFFTVDEVTEQRRQAQVEIDRCRRDAGYVKILSVSLDSQVQSAAVMDEASHARLRRVDSRDRLAIVVSSHLFKMQIDRTFRSDGEKAFLSEAEAIAWLMEEPATPAAVEPPSSTPLT